jgi:23S rRNA (cytidine1920-2'-O)/16S rRNA (cytidine1409-2'-O)-methyltransferase
MPPIKTRLDVLLVDRNLAPSRQRAQALIMAGKVLVNQVPLTKPGTRIRNSDNVSLKGTDIPYVSRGGIKLAHALSAFNLNVDGRVCMDVGASTGGFTDCLLQAGATKVLAVDVGYGQLAWKLRQDPRVVILERTNIRNLTVQEVPFPIDLASIDVSFISLRIVLPAIQKFLGDDAHIVALIKPQFEVGKELVGKGGVVKDPRLHADVIQSLKQFCIASGIKVLGLTTSPITGPKGNKEFLIHLKK